MKRSEAKITAEINSQPEKVWGVIETGGNVDKWFSSLVESCRIENGKRFCHMKNGIDLIEEIIEVNHQTKTFIFGIPKQNMLPVENIIETIKVLPSKNGGSILEWSGSWDVLPENEATASEAFVGLWNMGVTDLENYLKTI